MYETDRDMYSCFTFLCAVYCGDVWGCMMESHITPLSSLKNDHNLPKQNINLDCFALRRSSSSLLHTRRDTQEVVWICAHFHDKVRVLSLGFCVIMYVQRSSSYIICPTLSGRCLFLCIEGKMLVGVFACNHLLPHLWGATCSTYHSWEITFKYNYSQSEVIQTWAWLHGSCSSKCQQSKLYFIPGNSSGTALPGK